MLMLLQFLFKTNDTVSELLIDELSLLHMGNHSLLKLI